MKRWIWLIGLIGLGACSPPPPPAAIPPSERDVVRERLLQLPGGALTEEGARLVLAYGDEVLFASGAVLPLPGGVALLDPLAQALRELEGDWRLVVRADTADPPAYAQRLAEGRMRVLRRFLTQRGLAETRYLLEPGADAGPALTVTWEESGTGQAMSAGEKR